LAGAALVVLGLCGRRMVMPAKSPVAVKHAVMKKPSRYPPVKAELTVSCWVKRCAV
jgi:hypothetical protein